MKDLSILVAVDFSENATTALKTAARLADQRDAPLTVLHCLEWPFVSHGKISEKSRNEYRQRAMRKLRETFENAVPSPERPSRVDFEVVLRSPVRGIEETLQAHEFDLVVLGATGLNRVANFFVGSVTEDVVRRSSIPVLVVSGDAETAPYEEIVAPVDFTHCSRVSLDRAADLARRDGAHLTIIHALPVAEDLQAIPVPTTANIENRDALEKRRSEKFDEFLAEAELEDVDWEARKRVGSPFETILQSVDELDADLVVMGTHGRHGVERLFLGSTAQKVLRRMPCSLLTVRAREDASEK